MQNLLSTQKAGADVHSSLLTLEQSVWQDTFQILTPFPDPSYKLVFLGQSVEPICKKLSPILSKEFHCSHA